MEFNEIEEVKLEDVCVTPTIDIKKFGAAEKEIYKITKKKFMITKNQKDKAFNNIKAHFKVASTIYNNNSNNKDSNNLAKQYSGLMEAIREKFGSIPQITFQAIPINSIKINYDHAVSIYNNIIDQINSLSDEEKEIMGNDKKFIRDISMIKAGISGVVALCSSRSSTWDGRSSNTNELLSNAKTLSKTLSTRIKRSLENVALKGKCGEDTEKSSPEDIATHKKLLSQCGNNSVEYRKWWIWYQISLWNSIPADIKVQLLDFDPKNPSSINLKNVKKPITLVNYTSIKYLVNEITKLKDIPTNRLFVVISQTDPYLHKLIDYKLNSELQAFKIAAQSLLEDLKKELKNREILINSDISKVKPTNDVIDNILNVLKKCSKNSKNPFPNSLRVSLYQYIEGRNGVSSNNINAVLRNTLNILEKDEYGKYFDPTIYARLCHHVRTIINAFKEDSNRGGIITKTSSDRTVLRGMDYIGLRAMFKNGGYKIPDDRKEFNQSIIDDINKKQPTIFDKAVLSTTMSDQLAPAFTLGKVMLSISVPKGTKSVNVPRAMRRAYFATVEDELILPPSTKLKVTKCNISNDDWINVEAKVVN